jgi:hypothetical protein
MSEYKPGTVALVEAGCWANRVVAIRTGVPNNMGWAYCGTRDGQSTQAWSPDTSGIVTPLRPLAVIDPEDRGEVERLMDPLRRMGFAPHACGAVDCLTTALREFAKPTPPKPAEPLGLGAVVEDAEGRWWSRLGGTTGYPWHHGLQGRAHYAHIDAVRVLSEGVTDA